MNSEMAYSIDKTSFLLVWRCLSDIKIALYIACFVFLSQFEPLFGLPRDTLLVECF